MTYKSNNNREGNHKKKSRSWEKAPLPRKRKETLEERLNTTKQHSRGRERDTLSESHARCIGQN